MATIRGFIAASVDGYIADKDGKIDWLKPFERVDYGYDDFIATIGTVVLGRTTYDQIASFGIGWPYAGKRGFIVTSKAISDPPERVEAWQDGVENLVPVLRAIDDGDIWIVGGAQLHSTFLAAGELDRLELFLIPVLLGDGVPLFSSGETNCRLSLNGARSLGSGMVRLDYGLRCE